MSSAPTFCGTTTGRATGNDSPGEGAMFDLIVSGGTAVMPASTEAADIGVSGGRIAAIGAAGTLAAAGQIVIAGGIDPHIHAGMPILGGPSNEDVFSAGPDQVSR